MSALLLLFEDQLTEESPVLEAGDKYRDVLILIDSASATDRSAASRRFRARAMDAHAEALRLSGWSVEIVDVDRHEGRSALSRAIKWRLGDARRFIAAEPGDAAMRRSLERLASRFRLCVDILNDNRFICDRGEFAMMRRNLSNFDGFYRLMRQRTGLLMEGEEPAGGRWRVIDAPSAPDRKRRRVVGGYFEQMSPDAFQAKRDLERFLETTLPRLGACEHLDPRRPHAFPCPDVERMMNAGLINPLIACWRIDRAWRDGAAPLHAAEHAIYHILGLREYRRGLMRLGETPADYAPPNQIDAADEEAGAAGIPFGAGAGRARAAL